MEIDGQLNKYSFQQAVKRHLVVSYATDIEHADQHTWYLAMARTLSELTTTNLLAVEQDPAYQNKKSLNYLSLEFLIGRLTGNNLLNMGLYQMVDEAMTELGFPLVDLLENERDPALGNGGLGRLAACFLDSLAALEFPSVGYGLHYEYGLFRQSFSEEQQKEAPDDWRGIDGYPWEVARPHFMQKVGFYGSVEVYEADGEMKRRWKPSMFVQAMPWDVPVVGYHNHTVYNLRLWECRADAPFSLESFNNGNYFESQHALIDAGNITKVLYPNDQHEKGKALRLMQQYFHCAASMQDILRRHHAAGHSLMELPRYQTVQLNDTHPAIAIPELMRLLIDDYQLSWQQAWQIVPQVFAYTNHTLLPEALETWDETLIVHILPRHMEIIHEINRRFLNLVRKTWPGDKHKLRKLSIVDDGFQHIVRMAHLSVIGSYSVNGVASLHTELLRKNLFADFEVLYPGRIRNITNGITPRRWLQLCNPALSQLISDKIGGDWPINLAKLRALSQWADDPDFQRAYMQIKKENKQRLTAWVKQHLDIDIDPTAIFDMQIKRLHEYKRQHLNLLHILSLYHRILSDDTFDPHPRVFFFAAKAAPGYYLAKEIIYAINCVAKYINQDTRLKNKLKIVFVPDYRVSIAELMIPAADVSEQISMAGKEASGTGNMKLSLNGALTVGTLDGANVEILEEVGEENIYIFGHTVESIETISYEGYDPYQYYQADPLLKASIDCLRRPEFCGKDADRFRSIIDSIIESDSYYLCADFADYIRAQQAIDLQYRDQATWARKAILNTAYMGKFSSDRSIQEYVDQIWKLESVQKQAPGKMFATPETERLIAVTA